MPRKTLVLRDAPRPQAAKQATTTIPIIMIGTGDPVRVGLGESRPSGRKYHRKYGAGPTDWGQTVAALKLAVPTMSRVAFLWNPNNFSHAAYLDEWKSAAPALGVEVLLVVVRSLDEFDNSFAAMMRERPDAFTMTADSLHQLRIEWIIDFLARNRLPGMYQVRENAGALTSYGASWPHLFRRAAGYVDKILQGTRPADLPVEQPTKFELVVNLRTAKGLGLTIPEPFLLLADEVIE